MNKVQQPIPRLNLGRRRRADDVADQIVRLIEAGEFRPESQLPPERVEREMAAMWGGGVRTLGVKDKGPALKKPTGRERT